MINSTNFSVNNVFLKIKDIVKDKYGGKRIKIVYEDNPLLIKQNEFIEVLLKSPIKYNDQYMPPTLWITLLNNGKLLEIIKNIEDKLGEILLTKKVSEILEIDNTIQKFNSIIKKKNGSYHIYPKLKCQFDEKTGKVQKIFTKFLNSNTNNIIRVSHYLNGSDILNQKAEIVLHFDNLYITSQNKIWLQVYVFVCYVEFSDDANKRILTNEKVKVMKKDYEKFVNTKFMILIFFLMIGILIIHQILQ
jgi:hypothetical protein